MSAFLASVRNLSEAVMAHRAGADWIDLKEPAAGALGAVDLSTVEEVVQWLRRQARKVSISATIGDCWNTPALMPNRVAKLRVAGVDYAKIGLYAAAPAVELRQTIWDCCHVGPRIIVVCFAEKPPRSDDVRAYAACGIDGIMLDTANKSGPALLGLMSTNALLEFVIEAHRHGLICGLAGSLTSGDIEKLSTLHADYLGFRGALCHNAMRKSDFSLTAALSVRARIDAVSKRLSKGRHGQPNRDKVCAKS